MAAIAFCIGLQSLIRIFPLTSLELGLRRTDRGSFMGRYAGKRVYARLAPGLVFAGTPVVTFASLWVYFAPQGGALGPARRHIRA